jgi:hypothetical protein
LHRKLAAHNKNGPAIAGSDGEDSDAAISFSEGRRTPLPPVEDEDEDANNTPGMQAMFYTPEASNSPTRAEFLDKDQGAAEHEFDGSDHRRETGIERLPSPLQAVASA